VQSDWTETAVVAWLIRKLEPEPEDVTIGFLGPSLADITGSASTDIAMHLQIRPQPAARSRSGRIRA
jgi:hypothetical protein